MNMKNAILMFCAAIMPAIVLLPSCAGGAPTQETGSSGTAAHENVADGTATQETGSGGTTAQETGTVFQDVEGRDWLLTELRSAGRSVPIDRTKLEAANLNANAYTIRFADGMVFGTGWPNTYRGPYTAGNNSTLKLGNMATTMMMSFVELDALKEHEYYAYLGKVTRWGLRNGKLELYSANDSGAETVLVFNPN